MRFLIPALRAGTNRAVYVWRQIGWRLDERLGWVPQYAPQPIAVYPR